MSPPLISKAAARYTGAGGKEHCSLCRHFSPRRGGRCARVLGDISPMGWCKLFSREMRGMVADASSFNGGGGGPSLALDFMTPGTLDPRLTFTRASTATYFNSAGVMQTAAVNAPRWDYDPVTLALRGMLVEEARTNVIRNSTMVGAVAGTPGTDPTGWVINLPAGVTKTIVATGTDRGIAYIDYRLQAAAATQGNLNILFAPTTTGGAAATAATVYTQSLYMTPIAGTFSLVGSVFTVFMNQFDAGGANLGAQTSTNFVTAPYVVGDPLTSHRPAYTWAATPANTAFVQPALRLPIPAGVVDFTVRIGGPMLEAGAFATSYVPTTSAAVTRAADNLQILPANMGFWVSPGGSWFAEFIGQTTPPSGSPRVVGYLGGSNRAHIFVTGANNVGIYDGAAFAPTAATLPLNVVARAASAWGAGIGRVCLNGGAVASGSLATGFGDTGLAGTGILGSGAATEYLTGYVRRVRYWSRILTDAEMQTVTTP